MFSDFRPDKYVLPYTDFGFKKIFGTEQNKDLLISFLNSLFEGKEVIKDLQFLNNKEKAKRDSRIIFDACCENEQGEKLLIEMQLGEEQFFKNKR